jgi:chromosome segregation ATPase
MRRKRCVSSIRRCNNANQLQALDTKKEELHALKAELDEKTVELNETRGAEIEMRNKLEEYQKTVNEAQKLLNHWHEKLGKLTVHNIRYNLAFSFSLYKTDHRVTAISEKNRTQKHPRYRHTLPTNLPTCQRTF